MAPPYCYLIGFSNGGSGMRIAIVAPSTPILPETASLVTAIAAEACPRAELVFDPQCFLSHNHFAGPDAARARAFVAVASNAAVDAMWFARGGYGSCGIADAVLARLERASRGKAYLGYTD